RGAIILRLHERGGYAARNCRREGHGTYGNPHLRPPVLGEGLNATAGAEFPTRHRTNAKRRISVIRHRTRSRDRSICGSVAALIPTGACHPPPSARACAGGAPTAASRSWRLPVWRRFRSVT